MKSTNFGSLTTEVVVYCDYIYVQLWDSDYKRLLHQWSGLAELEGQYVQHQILKKEKLSGSDNYVKM